MEIDKNILTAALATAVANSISTEVQKEIFAKALHEHLFAEDHRNGDRSPVKDAFAKALNQVTHELALKVVSEPENAARIEGAFRDALDKVLKDGAIVTNIATKMVNALRY